MRSLLPFAVFCSVALAACLPVQQKQNLPTIPPAEVLQKTAEASQNLTSAQFTVQGEFALKQDDMGASGTLRMNGTLHDAGDQLQFSLDTNADVESDNNAFSLSGAFDVAVLSTQEVYLRVNTLSTEPSSALFDPGVINTIADTWWIIPQEDSPSTETVITPDPRLLQAQAQVISVTRDYGVVSANGYEAHYYATRLDKQKLVAYLSALAAERGEPFDSIEIAQKLEDVSATGEIWIDTQTYHVHRLRWDAKALPIDRGMVDLEVQIDFRNHNSAPAISSPEDPKVFSPAFLYALPLQSL